jgi:hypothetical protein
VAGTAGNRSEGGGGERGAPASVGCWVKGLRGVLARAAAFKHQPAGFISTDKQSKQGATCSTGISN